MTIMSKRGNLDNVVTYEHICDTTADMQKIDSKYITLGSTCIVISGDTGGMEVYLANSNKTWSPLGMISGGSSGSSISILNIDDLDANGVPNLENPQTNLLYLAPTDTGYNQFVYVNNTWKNVGVDNANWTAQSGASGYVENKPSIKAGTGTNAIIEGNITNNKATKANAHAEGDITTASGLGSHAEGSETTASANYSHAEGYRATASQLQAHAEGNHTVASGNSAHAEGVETEATGLAAHAEGEGTEASGYNAHAEGNTSSAAGHFSHAEGYETLASRRAHHVFGEYNIDDAAATANERMTRGTYVEIVGNGKSPSTRSNARTLDWNGNEWLAGGLTTAGAITIGSTTITEMQLQSLLALLS